MAGLFHTGPWSDPRLTEDLPFCGMLCARPWLQRCLSANFICKNRSISHEASNQELFLIMSTNDSCGSVAGLTGRHGPTPCATIGSTGVRVLVCAGLYDSCSLERNSVADLFNFLSVSFEYFFPFWSNFLQQRRVVLCSI